MLRVDGIRKGIVLDHITAGLGYKIFRELKLDEVDYTTALIKNVCSNKLRKKDLIKIDNVINIDLQVMGLIDPNITICVIEDEQVVKKIKLDLPKKVNGILKCKNPRCISTVEKNVETTFTLIDAEHRTYRCEYCNTPASM